MHDRCMQESTAVMAPTAPKRAASRSLARITHLLDMVEGVLGDIGDAHVGVLPDSAGGGLCLAGQDLDHGRLAGSIGAKHSHTAVERAEQADVLQRVLLSARVLEGDVVHLEDGSVLGLDALQEARLGQHEGEALGGGQLVVGARLGLLLHKLGQVPLQPRKQHIDSCCRHKILTRERHDTQRQH